MKKNKNSQPQTKFTGSYIKKSVLEKQGALQSIFQIESLPVWTKISSPRFSNKEYLEPPDFANFKLIGLQSCDFSYVSSSIHQLHWIIKKWQREWQNHWHNRLSKVKVNKHQYFYTRDFISIINSERAQT